MKWHGIARKRCQDSCSIEFMQSLIFARVRQNTHVLVRRVFLGIRAFLPRFLVLEHGTLLVYASEDDWAEHQEPLDDVALSAGSTVETTQEGAEVRQFPLVQM